MKARTLVIGGTSAIGQAIVNALLNANHQVHFTCRDLAKGQQLFSEALSEKQLEMSQLDVTEPTSVNNFFDATKQIKFCQLVYVPGYHRVAPVSAVSDGDLNRHIQLNLTAPVDCIRAFLSNKYSDSSVQRRVVAINSIAHFRSEPGLMAYSASKAALAMAIRTLAREYAKRNVTLNCVSAGWIQSETADKMRATFGEERINQIKSDYPLGFGEPCDVAGAVRYLLSDSAKWMTGQDLVLDGGLTA